MTAPAGSRIGRHRVSLLFDSKTQTFQVFKINQRPNQQDNWCLLLEFNQNFVLQTLTREPNWLREKSYVNRFLGSSQRKVELSLGIELVTLHPTKRGRYSLVSPTGLVFSQAYSRKTRRFAKVVPHVKQRLAWTSAVKGGACVHVSISCIAYQQSHSQARIGVNRVNDQILNSRYLGKL